MAFDFKTYYTGAVSGGDPQTDPDASLGGNSSSSVAPSSSSENLFSNVEFDEASAGSTKYRCVVLRNDGTSVVSFAIFTDPPSGSGSGGTDSDDSSVELGLESVTAGNGSGLSIANEDTAPVGIVFAAHPSSSKLAVGNVNAGQEVRLWVKRIIGVSSANFANDGFKLLFRGA